MKAKSTRSLDAATHASSQGLSRGRKPNQRTVSAWESIHQAAPMATANNHQITPNSQPSYEAELIPPPELPMPELWTLTENGLGPVSSEVEASLKQESEEHEQPLSVVRSGDE